MERNDVLIDKVLGYIREHPQEWDQRFWGEKNVCGTRACFAGHAMLLSGYSLESRQRGCENPEDVDHSCDVHGCTKFDDVFVRPDGFIIDRGHDREAAKLLGLESFDASRIFLGTRITDIEELQKLIDEIRAR